MTGPRADAFELRVLFGLGLSDDQIAARMGRSASSIDNRR